MEFPAKTRKPPNKTKNWRADILQFKISFSTPEKKKILQKLASKYMVDFDINVIHDSLFYTDQSFL